MSVTDPYPIEGVEISDTQVSREFSVKISEIGEIIKISVPGQYLMEDLTQVVSDRGENMSYIVEDRVITVTNVKRPIEIQGFVNPYIVQEIKGWQITVLDEFGNTLA